MTTHPACCTDSNCQLSYRDHLLGFGVAMAAIPSRVSGEAKQTLIREGRWERDMKAYKNLRADGLQPPSIEGAALRERMGEDKYDIEHRPVTVDYSDPT